MPLRTTSRGSALLFLLLSCTFTYTYTHTQRISRPSPLESRNAFLSLHVFMVYPREREDALPTIRTGFSFLTVLSLRPARWPSISLSPSLPSRSFLRFFHRLAPGGPYESFNSIFFPDSALPVHLARRDTTRCPSRSIYSAPRPTPDPIPFSFYYEIIPNTYNLDWCISTICYLSRKAGIGSRAQRAAICVS